MFIALSYFTHIISKLDLTEHDIAADNTNPKLGITRLII